MIEALLLGMVFGGAVIALGYVARLRQKEREGLRDEFRHALIHALKTTPAHAFQLAGFAARCGVAEEIAQEVAEDLYARIFARAIADGQITDDEQRRLDQLTAALSLLPGKRQAIESRARQSRYSERLDAALADGVIGDEDARQLEGLRASLGLRREEVAKATGAVSRQAYLAQFRQMARRGNITSADAAYLVRLRSALGLAERDAFQVVRDDALALFRECFYEARQDGHISAQEERLLRNLQRFSGLSDADVAPYYHEIARVRTLERYRNGDLPTIRPRKILESGELCHWEGPCTYAWETRTAVHQAQGELAVTSSRIVFTSAMKGFEFKPAKIMDLTLYGDGVRIRTSGRHGTGAYFVNDPECFEAILTGVVRKHKYLAVESFSSSRSRHIPDDVKRDVWARDGGRCVRCGATEYLEYDHIIPHSKGGANTVNNIQILCRRCNLMKSDRI